MRPLTLDLGADSPLPIAANSNRPKQAKPDYYSGGVRIIRDGVPCRVAGWYRDLTKRGQSIIRGSEPRTNDLDLATRFSQTTYFIPDSREVD